MNDSARGRRKGWRPLCLHPFVPPTLPQEGCSRHGSRCISHQSMGMTQRHRVYARGWSSHTPPKIVSACRHLSGSRCHRQVILLCSLLSRFVSPHSRASICKSSKKKPICQISFLLYYNKVDFIFCFTSSPVPPFFLFFLVFSPFFSYFPLPTLDFGQESRKLSRFSENFPRKVWWVGAECLPLHPLSDGSPPTDSKSFFERIT